MSRVSLLFAALALPTGKAGIEITGFHLVESLKQRRSLEMTATVARLYKEENLSTLDNLTALLWNEHKNPYEIRGNQGILSTASQDFQILGDSQIISPDGFLFKTKNVFFDSTTQVLQSREAVQGHNRQQLRTKPGSGASLIEIEGEGLAIYTQKNIYEIKSRVKARQSLNPESTLFIQSVAAFVNPLAKSATFLKNVSVTSPSLNLKGERLVIDFYLQRPEKMKIDSPPSNSQKKPQFITANMKDMQINSLGLVVNFDSNTGNAQNSHAIGNVTARSSDGVKIRADELISDLTAAKQKITMKGHVEITTDARIATCQEAQYFPESGEFILEKIAAVKKGQEILEGERIRFSLKDSEVHVEKAKGRINKQSLGVNEERSSSR